MHIAPVSPPSTTEAWFGLLYSYVPFETYHSAYSVNAIWLLEFMELEPSKPETLRDVSVLRPAGLKVTGRN